MVVRLSGSTAALAAAAFAVLLSLPARPARAQPPGKSPTGSQAAAAISPQRPGSTPADLRRACEAVDAMSLPDTRLLMAQPIEPRPVYVVPETAHDVPGRFGGGPVRVTRPFCRVVGVVAPAIRFEVWVPLTEWNGRFEGLGLGAFSGAVPYAQMAAALARGYAVGGTDTGHESSGFDASWAMTPQRTLNRIAVEDWAYRGIHEMTAKSQAIIDAVFRRPPRYRYFVGCSSGGGQALAEAQRYPDDYDGIVAGAPANYWTHLMAGQLYYGLATRVDPATNLEMPIDKLVLLHAAALRACDGVDGVHDGIISQPLACHFDPRALACHGVDQADCLTLPEVEAARRIYGPARDAAGHTIFPGLAPGSELGWRAMSAGQVGFAQTFYRYLVFQNPSWDYANMHLAADVAYADHRIGAIVNETDADLRLFRVHGGKLLQYAGWADPLISPYNSIDYYRSVVATLDAGRTFAAGLADVGQFYRLFMVPGMGHCRGGGTDTFDALGSMQQWVEKGEVPAQILAAQLAGGKVVRTRPLCPYPQIAHYLGHGSSDSAANFRCTMPTER